MHMKYGSLIICILLHFHAAHFIHATTWFVGPSRTFTVPSQVMNLVQDGDSILIDAGEYIGDVGAWNANNLFISGIGGLAHLRANGQNAQGKAIWVVSGNNTTIEWIEFSEASVPDENGAGIRQQGGDLTIRHCYFHNNENGILASSNPNMTVIVEYSEFGFNGFGDGFTHNIYINDAEELILRYCYMHHAKVGHNVKTRARKNTIIYNRIMDEASGNSSYLLDMSNGGYSVVRGNLFHQGENAPNSSMIAYGLEGYGAGENRLYFYNNTLVNERNNGKFFNINSSHESVSIANNILAGSNNGIQVGGSNVDTFSNQLYPNINDADLVNPANYNYALKESAGAINLASNPPAGLPMPAKHYVHTADEEDRFIVDQLDIGAYEFGDPITDIDVYLEADNISLYPNPTEDIFEIEGLLSDFSLKILDMQGNIFRTLDNTGSSLNIDISTLPSGLYFIEIYDEGNQAVYFRNILKY